MANSESLFKPNKRYSFQVGVQNRHGDGSFSDSVTAESIPIPISQGIVVLIVVAT